MSIFSNQVLSSHSYMFSKHYPQLEIKCRLSVSCRYVHCKTLKYTCLYVERMWGQWIGKRVCTAVYHFPDLYVSSELSQHPSWIHSQRRNHTAKFKVLLCCSSWSHHAQLHNTAAPKFLARLWPQRTCLWDKRRIYRSRQYCRWIFLAVHKWSKLWYYSHWIHSVAWRIKVTLCKD